MFTKDGKILHEDEVFYWGDKPMTVSAIKVAIDQYEKTKERAKILTKKRREKQRQNNSK